MAHALGLYHGLAVFCYFLSVGGTAGSNIRVRLLHVQLPQCERVWLYSRARLGAASCVVQTSQATDSV